MTEQLMILCKVVYLHGIIKAFRSFGSNPSINKV